MASRYWVGGSATWDSTIGTKWAATSGGAGGVSVPTVADDVFFDASSTGTCTISSTSVCRSVNCTGFTGTISHPASTTWAVGDGTAGASNVALLFVSGMTYTIGAAATSLINFISTSTTTQTIATGSKTLACWTINGVGSSYQLTDNNTTNTGSTVTLTNGTLDTNGKTCDWGTFQGSNSNIRTLSLGASAITTRNVGANSWNVNTSTNLTLNAGTSSLTVIGGNNNSWFGTGLTYNNVTVSLGNGSHTFTQAGCTFNNLTFSGGQANGFHISNVVGNFTVSGTLTCTGTSGRIQVSGSTPGTPSVITAATVSLTNVDFEDITGAGAATWAGSSIGNMGGNSNITFTSAVTRYWVGTTGGTWDTVTTTNWSASSGGSGGSSAPLAQDTVIFDTNSITSSARTITINSARMGKDIDFSAIANNPTVSFNTAQMNVTGNLKLGASMTPTGANTLLLIGRGTQQLTTAGLTLSFAIQVANPTGTYALQDNLACTSSLTLTVGGFDANGHSVTCTTFSSSNSNIRTLSMGSATWALTGTGIVWNTGTNTNLTLNSGTSVIAPTDVSATSKTLAFAAGDSLSAITIPNGSGGAYILNSGGTWTVGTLTLGAGTTNTLQASRIINVTVLNVSGSAGNIVTIVSGTAGTKATISKVSGIVNADYISIKDNLATGGAAFYAGANSTNVSNNVGWAFYAQPSGFGNLMQALA